MLQAMLVIASRVTVFVCADGDSLALFCRVLGIPSQVFHMRMARFVCSYTFLPCGGGYVFLIDC